ASMRCRIAEYDTFQRAASWLAMQPRQRLEDLRALRRFAIGADERLRGREFLLRVASLQREPLHRHQRMADPKPFDEVRIRQRIVRRRPVGACELTLDPGKSRAAQFWRRLEIELQEVAHQKRSIHV